MRYIILLSAVIMQMCLGATYSWSVYVAPIKLLTGLQQGPVQVPFTTFYLVFPLTMVFAGTILPRTGPRFLAVTGGVLFGGGWLLASLGIKHFVFTTLGIGVMSGIGAGLAYIVPIAVCVRWFPGQKGLVTGIAVAGFGGGAALVSQAGGFFMESAGRTPFATFALFGLVFLCTAGAAGSTMKFPAKTKHCAPPPPVSISQIFRSPLFRLLYFAMFTGLAAGFGVNANLKELFPTDSFEAVRIGITGVALFAVANAAGRILWGVFFDRTKSSTAIGTNLILQSAALLASPALLTTPEGFLVLAVVCGFNYGGILVLYVATATRCWGSERIGQVYGSLFSSNIPASLAPIVAGLIYDFSGSFTPFLYGLGLLLLAAAFFARKHALLLDCPGKDGLQSLNGRG
ncbi:MFS transporter [Desulforhopalus singaporensis]|uniref:Predicted arabinose efflux permease, MFS family n=1 Tax=Desulforhopalus singaporensis TaxID=91360 RepID=A0A1H0TM11_9BACT|nr:MFS transporter [Desulforhopalus singaporensis]SDP55077.1 Predicted arabinose efflux permease, MFS family [Desulforhopalus singaporensis]